MSWLKCSFILFVSCLIGLVNGGPTSTGHSDAIQRLDLSGQSTQELSTNTTEDSYVTKYKIKRYSYLWTIPKFSAYSQTIGTNLFSEKFPRGSNEQLKWVISVYPNGEDDDTRGNISVFVYLKECKLSNGEVQARIKLSILDENGIQREIRDSGQPNKFGALMDGWGFNEYINRKILFNPDSGLLLNDKLTIVCEIDALIEPIEVSNRVVDQLTTLDKDKRANVILEQLYTTREFNDIILSVNNKEFKAHKAILAANSPVFKEMITNDFDSYGINRLELADISSEVLEELLRFIYTGDLSSLVGPKQLMNDEQQRGDLQLAIGLLKASIKYQLDGLRSTCELALMRGISVDSVGELLLSAHSYNGTELKTQVIEFIRENYRQLYQTNSWIQTIKEAPTELITEVNKEIFKEPSEEKSF